MRVKANHVSVLFVLAVSACVKPLEVRTTESGLPQERPAQTEAMSYSLVFVRPGREQFWRIQSNGQGWVNVTSPSGFTPQHMSSSPHRYVFTQGQHSVNIGREGYARLRSLFGDVIDGNFDTSGVTNGDLRCIVQNVDSPGAELTWTHPRAGGLKHSFGCLGPKGIEAVARYNASWNIIAEGMIERGQSGAMDEGGGIPNSVTPLTIEITEKHPWTGLNVLWHVGPNGKGWVVLSDNMTITTDQGPRYIAKGRHAFDLGASGAQSVRTEFEPYISGPERFQECPERRTDQAMISVSWKSQARHSGRYRATLGCAALAQRVRTVQQIIGSGIGQ